MKYSLSKIKSPKEHILKTRTTKPEQNSKRTRRRSRAWWGYSLGLKYYLWSCRAGSQIYCHMLACMRQSCSFLLCDCFISSYKKRRDVRLNPLPNVTNSFKQSGFHLKVLLEWRLEQLLCLPATPKQCMKYVSNHSILRENKISKLLNQ